MVKKGLSKRIVAVLLIVAIIVSVVGIYMAAQRVVVEESRSVGIVQATVIPGESGYSVSVATVSANVVAGPIR